MGVFRYCRSQKELEEGKEVAGEAKGTKRRYIWAVVEYEFFPALTRGAKLVISGASAHKDPTALAKLITKYEVRWWPSRTWFTLERAGKNPLKSRATPCCVAGR